MQRNHKIKWIFFFTKCASTSEFQVSGMLCHTTKTCHFHTTGTSQKKEKRIHICLAHEKMQYYALTHWGIHCNLLYTKNEIFCLWYIVLFFFWWGDRDPFLMSQFPQRKSTQYSLTAWLFQKKLMLVLIERYQTTQCITVFCEWGCRPFRVTILTSVYCQKWLEHQNLITGQWKKVAWSDDSHFFYIIWTARCVCITYLENI